MINRLISIAPMMDCTDRHCRYFLRLISPHALLYTEMITTGAIIHGDRKYLLEYDPSEHPLALQLGGSDPKQLAECAKIAEDYGYDEVNLNVGCPSDRVQLGRFGACLMKEPELVAECVAAMRQATHIPITVKTRIGVDDQDSYLQLQHFIKSIAEAGCEIFIVHARKAWLQGLSPKENREIPPLRYDVVHQLKQDFPQLKIIINGGIKTSSQIQQHSQQVDGVMIGREAYYNPYWLAEIEQQFFATTADSRFALLEKYIPYVQKQIDQGERLSSMVRHILGLFRGIKGARTWRRFLSEKAYQGSAGSELIQLASVQWTQLYGEGQSSQP